MLVTLKKVINGYTIIATQTYNQQYDFGHYKTVIFDKQENIIHCTQTTCGAPDGKINEAVLSKTYKDYERWL